MKKLIKKSILNGIIRTFVSIIYTVFVKIKSFNYDQNNQINNYTQLIEKFSSNSIINENDSKENNEYHFDQEQESDNLQYYQIEQEYEKKCNVNEEYQNKPSIYYEYVNETGQVFKLSSSLLKQQEQKSIQIKSSSINKKYSRFKSIFVFILIIIAYVGLNNYLIMFVYYQSSTTSSRSVSNSASEKEKIYSGDTKSIFLPLASLFRNSNKRKLNQNLDYNYYDKQKYSSDELLEKNFSKISNNDFKIYIDPLDINIEGFDKRKFNDFNRVILKDSYFYEEDEFMFQNINLSIVNATLVNKLRVKPRPCLLPKLNPYDSEIMQFVKKEDDIKCNPKKNWIYVENGTLRVSKSAIRKHGVIVCAYIPLYRGNNDFSVYEGNRIFPVMDKMPLISDFFKIDCRSKDGAIYSNIHSGIAYESSLHMRHIWNPMPKKALGYNVLMFGFDSVSRMSWIRMLPKSYEYMIKQGFIVLKGYNIVGDGTPQALLPILTGKKETELPEARRGFPNASYVDNFPWIWKEYKKAGYVTQWAEDMQLIGTFQLRMLGFRKQPVDHYMRPFYLEAERYYSRFRRLCLGSISRHKNMFNWVKEFFQLYDSKPKFSFIFHSEASHNYNNPLNLLDDDLKEFLVYLKKSGIMENTILLFMSDHGVRVSNLRQYSQGKLEERLPFFSVRMPKTFQEKYPEAIRNLRLNSRKLTTPFDIHETLIHFLNFDSYDIKKPFNSKHESKRGISLLKYISSNRTCEDAKIEAHWCSCLKWTEININSTKIDSLKNQNLDTSSSLFNSDESNEIKFNTNMLNDLNLNLSNIILNMTKLGLKKQKINFNEYKLIKLAHKNYNKPSILIANKAVEFINSLIDKELKLYCSKIYLHSIQKLSKLDLNRKLLTFKKSKDIHGREALFEDDLNINDTFDENFFIPLNSSNKFISEQNLNQSNMLNSKSFNGLNSTLLVDHSLLNLEHVFQIVLTTWPGNATYELSLKYNRFNGLFTFNKNEISRINNYNDTSNCMLDRRPDLRQYCFCRYL